MVTFYLMRIHLIISGDYQSQVISVSHFKKVNKIK